MIENPAECSFAYSPPLLTQAFFERPSQEVAPDLIGCSLHTIISGERAGGLIIETEAYRENDPFAHCYSSAEIPRTKSSDAMLGVPGGLYFYDAGQLPCLNIVCEAAGTGSAVLIRALSPTTNPALMLSRRTAWYVATNRPIPKYLSNPTQWEKNLCNGPAVLTEALGLSAEQIGIAKSIFDLPFQLSPPTRSLAITSGIRVGLDKQYTGWVRNRNPRANIATVNEFGAKKWRWGASDYRSYLRYPSFDQQWISVGKMQG